MGTVVFVIIEWKKLAAWSRERWVSGEGLGRLPERGRERELLSFPYNLGPTLGIMVPCHSVRLGGDGHQPIPPLSSAVVMSPHLGAPALYDLIKYTFILKSC